MLKGGLHLFPCTIGADDDTLYLPLQVKNNILACKIWLVENIRTTRRFLKHLDKSYNIDEASFFVLNKKTTPAELEAVKVHLQNGAAVGVMSEAGLPGVADPGNVITAYCHNKNIPVHPYVGPSSIFLALMASGLNGQHFEFHGYLGKNDDEQIKSLKNLELKVKKEGSTHIFMDTPFKNHRLFENALKCLHPDTQLCVAYGIQTPMEKIQCKPVKSWKKNKFEFKKVPCLFLIG